MTCWPSSDGSNEEATQTIFIGLLPTDPGDAADLSEPQGNRAIQSVREKEAELQVNSPVGDGRLSPGLVSISPHTRIARFRDI